MFWCDADHDDEDEGLVQQRTRSRATRSKGAGEGEGETSSLLGPSRLRGGRVEPEMGRTREEGESTSNVIPTIATTMEAFEDQSFDWSACCRCLHHASEDHDFPWF